MQLSAERITLYAQYYHGIQYMETNAPELLSTHPGRKLFLAGGFENGEEAKSIGLAGIQEAVDFFTAHMRKLIPG